MLCRYRLLLLILCCSTTSSCVSRWRACVASSPQSPNRVLSLYLMWARRAVWTFVFFFRRRVDVCLLSFLVAYHCSFIKDGRVVDRCFNVEHPIDGEYYGGGVVCNAKTYDALARSLLKTLDDSMRRMLSVVLALFCVSLCLCAQCLYRSVSVCVAKRRRRRRRRRQRRRLLLRRRRRRARPCRRRARRRRRRRRRSTRRSDRLSCRLRWQLAVRVV